MADETSLPVNTDALPVEAVLPEAPIKPTEGRLKFKTVKEAEKFRESRVRGKLFNTSTLKSEELPYSKVAESILSGTHGFKKDAEVRVVDDETGETYKTVGKDVPELLQMGYRIESPEEASIREHLEKPENKGLAGASKVFTTSLLNEAAFGVPKVLESYTADTMDIAKRKAVEEEFKFADYAGMVPGIIFSAVTTGGAGKAAVSLLDDAAAKHAAKQATIQGGKEAAKAGATAESIKTLRNIAKSKAGEFGIEGAVYAAPTAITEAAFGDYDSAAQTLLMSGGASALFGGTLSGLSKLYKGAKDVITNRIVNEDSARRTAYEITGMSGEQLTKMFENNPRALNDLPQYLAEFGQIDPKLLADNMTLGKLIELRTEAAGKALGQSYKEIDDLVTARIANPQTAPEVVQAIKNAHVDYDKILTELEEKYVTPNKLTELVDGKPTVTYKTDQIREVEDFIQTQRKFLQAKHGSTKPRSLEVAQEIKNDLRSQIKTRDATKKGSLLNQAAKDFEGKIRDEVNDRILPLFKQEFPEKAYLADDIISRNRDFEIGSIIERPTYKEHFKKEVTKPNATIVDLGVTFVAQNAKKALEYLATKEVLKKVYGNWQLKNLAAINKTLLKEAEKVEKIPAILRGAQKWNEVFQGRDIGRAAYGIQGLANEVFNLKDDKKDNEQLYKEISEKVSEYTASPEYTVKKLSDLTGPMAELGAPMLAASLTGMSQLQLQYIQDALPKPLTLENPIFKQKAYIPSDRDMYKFGRKLEVIANPAIIVRNLQDGSLSQDEVQVAQDLYPYVLDKIRQKVVDYLASETKTIPYAQRMKYALLLGIDSDSSLNPANLAKLQETYITYLNNPPPNQTGSAPKSLSSSREEDYSTAVDRFQT